MESRTDVAGILFCTFEFEQLRNKAIEILKDAVLKTISIIVRVPLNIRDPRSFLLSL